jgi:hypothetical protein
VRTVRQDAQGAGWGWYAGNKNEASHNTQRKISSVIGCTVLRNPTTQVRWPKVGDSTWPDQMECPTVLDLHLLVSSPFSLACCVVRSGNFSSIADTTGGRAPTHQLATMRSRQSCFARSRLPLRSRSRVRREMRGEVGTERADSLVRRSRSCRTTKGRRGETRQLTRHRQDTRSDRGTIRIGATSARGRPPPLAACRCVSQHGGF